MLQIQSIIGSGFIRCFSVDDDDEKEWCPLVCTADVDVVRVRVRVRVMLSKGVWLVRILDAFIIVELLTDWHHGFSELNSQFMISQALHNLRIYKSRYCRN